MTTSNPATARPAFVTGGSSGIGLAMAERLARRGHPLALFARDAARLEQAAAQIRRSVPGARVETRAVDVADRAALAAALDTALAELGAPSVAVAAAGIAVPGEFMDQPAEDFDRHMAVNYAGSLDFARHLARPMADAGGGSLVFVASVAAYFGITGYAAYAPSKFALRGLAEVLRVELAPLGIRVTLLCPPDTDTPQLAAEALTKPPATAEITAAGGLWQAGAVADAALAAMDRGRFLVVPGVQGKLIAAMAGLIAPALRLWQGRILRRHMRRG